MADSLVNRFNLQRRQGRAPAPELAALRDRMGEAIARYPRHPEVGLDYRTFGGVRCLVLSPREGRGSMVYFHGGGFRIGSPEISAGFASHLAARSRCRIIIPFYGLAPEHPFPGGLLDGEAVVSALEGDGPLLIGGDSAGGNLAAVLARGFADRVAGVLLLSPWLDLRLTAESYRTNAEVDTVFSEEAARGAAELYLQGHSPLDAEVSPLLGDLSAMPPCLIAVGSGEVLLDDARDFAERLAACRRTVSLNVIADMYHVEPTLNPDSANTREVLALAAGFVDRRFGG